MKLALINIEVIRYFMHIFVDFLQLLGLSYEQRKVDLSRC